MNNHVSGKGDGDNPDRGDEPERVFTKVSQLQAGGAQNHAEFRNLSGGNAREETRPPPITHKPHDNEYN